MRELMQALAALSPIGRLAAALSVLWIGFMFFVALQFASRGPDFHVTQFLMDFLSVGVAPVLFGWAVRSFRLKRAGRG